MKAYTSIFPALTAFMAVFMLWTACQQRPSTVVDPASGADSLFIDLVWTGHPVRFFLLTEPPHQFIAYYDTSRAMIVAQRQIGEDHWQKKTLPETIGWDSHNYITMALDSKGFLHLSGNMHADSLVYFQATTPYDIISLERKRKLIGDLEDRVTYPKFFSDPEGDLIFTYRDGGSGNGNQIYNRYDPDTGQWSRLLDTPLTDGKGLMNAYLHGPIPGPDHYYHLIWVWRDTPDAATNHDLSYAKSKDLVHWEKSDGSPQPLPITLENCEIIDPVPAGQGMINGNIAIGFDPGNRAIVTYHKFGPGGNTQIYNARREAGGWKSYQTTNWTFRWDFGGRGSIDKRVDLSAIEIENGQLTQKYWLDTVGWKKYLLDIAYLPTVKEVPLEKGYPEKLEQVRSGFPDMQVHLITQPGPENGLYVLRWETLPRNRDRPRSGTLPDPSPLVLYRYGN